LLEERAAARDPPSAAPPAKPASLVRDEEAILFGAAPGDLLPRAWRRGGGHPLPRSGRGPRRHAGSSAHGRDEHAGAVRGRIGAGQVAETLGRAENGDARLFGP